MFIVFSQKFDESHRVSECWGPFKTYDNAARFIKRLRKDLDAIGITDNDVWIGIRELTSGRPWRKK